MTKARSTGDISLASRITKDTSGETKNIGSIFPSSEATDSGLEIMGSTSRISDNTSRSINDVFSTIDSVLTEVGCRLEIIDKVDKAENSSKISAFHNNNNKQQS